MLNQQQPTTASFSHQLASITSLGAVKQIGFCWQGNATHKPATVKVLKKSLRRDMTHPLFIDLIFPVWCLVEREMGLLSHLVTPSLLCYRVFGCRGMGVTMHQHTNFAFNCQLSCCVAISISRTWCRNNFCGLVVLFNVGLCSSSWTSRCWWRYSLTNKFFMENMWMINLIHRLMSTRNADVSEETMIIHEEIMIIHSLVLVNNFRMENMWVSTECKCLWRNLVDDQTHPLLDVDTECICNNWSKKWDPDLLSSDVEFSSNSEIWLTVTR